MDSHFFVSGHFHTQDWLNSLTMQNVRILCYPLDDSHSTPQIAKQYSSIYDPNLVFNHSSNTKHHSSTSPYRLLEKYYECELKKNPNRRGFLDIGSRQAIIDYVTREKIRVSAQFLLYLIRDGAFYKLDLWQLCENNDFTLEEMSQILTSLQEYSCCIKSLTLGGNSWIYETSLVSVPLKCLLTGSLKSLETLKLQQLPTEIDLISLLRACPNLKCFEISQPSITGRELNRVAKELMSNGETLPVFDSLRSLHLPSSTSESGLQAILAFFPNLRRLHCTPFEQLLDILDLNTCEYSSRTRKVLSSLDSLSIMHPLSSDACERLTKLCSGLRHLRIEVQEGMNVCQLVEKLPLLKRLELINSVSMPLDYTEHIQPALNACGQRLESLSLELFDHINLTKLARSCPNLKHLSAQWFNSLTLPHIRYYRLFTPKNQYAFQRLEKLRLRPRPHQALSESVIVFLLNHSRLLRHIELYCCSELTDPVIDEVGKMNELRCLQSFIIRHGHSVTNAGLFRLLARSLAAGSLVFHDCGLGPPEKAKDQAEVNGA